MNFIFVIVFLFLINSTVQFVQSLNDHGEIVNSTNFLANDESDKPTRFTDSNCPHKDYRSYVKCLQTHRRHEHGAQATSMRGPRTNPGGNSNCVEECERESCRHLQSITGPCAEICYDRCLKKTKEIHHRITEYETTNCNEDENCDDAGKSNSGRGYPPITNLTTSIDIRNYVNNTNVIVHNNPKINNDPKVDGDQGEKKNHENKNNTCKGTGQSGSDETGAEGPRVIGQPPGFQPWYPVPSLAIIPQIQMVPQVTFGIGIAPGIGFGSIGNGCAYSSIWLCLQQQQQQQSQQIRDCSGCVQPYPYSRGRCDPSC